MDLTRVLNGELTFLPQARAGSARAVAERSLAGAIGAFPLLLLPVSLPFFPRLKVVVLRTCDFACIGLFLLVLFFPISTNPSTLSSFLKYTCERPE